MVEAIVAAERNVAHRIIEEFMLLANETVAGHLERDERADALPRARGAGPGEGRGIRGVHLDARDTRCPARPIACEPRDFQRLVERIHGRPEEKPIAFLLLRTMQKARYDAANLGHFGLAARAYTHFTSPIRRYPDLVVHRVLRESRRGMSEERRAELVEDLPEIARHTSERERRANDAERELVQWKKVRFMADKVGDEFDGYITGVSAFGFYVELVEHFVEGMVHVSTMADDYYRFVERAHILRGEKTRKVYRLGDRVRVQVVRVDLERRQVDLGLAEILDAVRSSGKGRAPRREKAAPARHDQPQRPGHARDRGRRRGQSGRGERQRRRR